MSAGFLVSNIQPALPPIANTSSTPPSGAAAKGEAGASADFLSLVVDAAAEEAPKAESEGIVAPPADEKPDTVAESAEGSLAVVAVPTILPEMVAVLPTAELSAEAPLAPLPNVGEGQASTDPLEQALAQAGKAKAISDALLAAQTPINAAEETVETPIDAKAAASIDAEPIDEKRLKEQVASLPGSALSMTETPETGAEILPAALAFRKALDGRANAERAAEPTTESGRTETPRSEARPTTDANMILRAAADSPTTTTATADEQTLSTSLDHGAKLGQNDNPLDALLGGKSGDAKHANFTAALTMVKGVAVNPQAVVAQVAVQLTAAGKAKTQAMTVKLEPVELGKIDIRLDFGADGKVQASIVADRPQTLDMLQKDARGLEKALQSAGLQTDSGSLSFNLRGQDRDQAQNGGGKFFAGEDSDAAFGNETLSVIAGPARSAAVGRVDMLL